MVAYLIAIVSTFVLYCWTDAQIPNCVDAHRTLRCVVPSNCPPKRGVSRRRCPSGMICCRKDPPNLYMPLRNVSISTRQPDFIVRGRALKNRSQTTTNPARNERIQLYKDRIIFPSEFDKRVEKEQSSSKTGGDRIIEAYDFFDKPKKNLSENVRKSVKYCREYTKLTIDVGYAVHLLAKLIPMRYEMENCDPIVTHLVVGGINASVSEFPHMVALGFNRSGELEYLCGGSLISDEFILTAAHCIKTRWGPPIVVYMGDIRLHTKKALTISIQKTHVHPDYKPPACYKDIALIQLATKVKLTSKLRPACLPDEDTPAQKPNKVVVATGWGRRGFGREPPVNLLKVALRVMDSKTCWKYYESDVSTPSLPKGISDDMLCANGSTHRTQDTCQGDSGGPLQAYLPDNRCMLQVLGITSFGKSCGSGVPGVYTKVAAYLDWIENIVWP